MFRSRARRSSQRRLPHAPGRGGDDPSGACRAVDRHRADRPRGRRPHRHLSHAHRGLHVGVLAPHGGGHPGLRGRRPCLSDRARVGRRPDQVTAPVRVQRQRRRAGNPTADLRRTPHSCFCRPAPVAPDPRTASGRGRGDDDRGRAGPGRCREPDARVDSRGADRPGRPDRTARCDRSASRRAVRRRDEPDRPDAMPPTRGRRPRVVLGRGYRPCQGRDGARRHGRSCALPEDDHACRLRDSYP